MLKGQGSYIVLDFGKEVGGIVSLQFGAVDGGVQTLAMAFSESSLHTGLTSDLSSAPSGDDKWLPVMAAGSAEYAMPASELRGGFRYLTVGLTSDGSVELMGVKLQFTAAPAMTDLRAYKGEFISNDDLLNRIWYAGAYTVQMDTIDPRQGRVWPPPASGWLNNGVVGAGATVLTDGAKRDRSVWPGDLGISGITDYVSLGDTLSVKNDLDTLFALQVPSGCLPYSGPEMSFGCVSDTYHLWTLNDAIEYYAYSGDRAWVIAHWPQIQSGIQFSTEKIGSDGLFSATLPEDWGRLAIGEEAAANALLYHVLQGAGYLASVVGDPASSARYEAEAAALRGAIQSLLWDEKAGMYADTPGSSLYPQDGNSLALWFGIPETAAQSMEVSAKLRNRWNGYGAITPERPGAIATFPGSMEVMAHFAAEDDQSALDLIRREWGYMLSSSLGTKSTFWEGYREDGSFDYGGNYVSLAHGWATGPTGALTEFVAGVGPEMSPSAQFHFIPHAGELSWVSAVLPLPAGTISVSWRHTGRTFTANVSAPSAMAGRYGIPIASHAASIQVDGSPAWSSCVSLPAGPYGEFSLEGNRVYFIMTGSHVITEKDSCH